MTAPSTALVLAGGQGTRMAATHADVPKPLVRVRGMPLLTLVLRQLRRHGVEDVHLALRHRAAEIEEHLARDGTPDFRSLRCHREQLPLGTAGALALLAAVPGDVLVVNADLLSGIDLGMLGRVHAERRADMTIATHWENRRLELGEVLVDGDERVTDYVEKPIKRYRISSGTYVVGRRVRELVGPAGWLPLPELVQRAIAARMRVVAHDHGAAWIDVNTSADLVVAERLLADDPIAFGLRADELQSAVLRWGIVP